MKFVFIIIIFSLFSSPLSVFARTWPDTYYKEQDYLSVIDVYPYDNSDAGDGVVVALIGDGVQTDHIDYWSNVTTGWNFIDATSEIKTYGSYDTAVAGVIAATQDIKGTIGITPKAKIMSLVVCDESDCYQDYIIEAINYAVDNGADVIALTLGSVGGVMNYTTDLDEIIEYAYENDVLIVAGMEPESDADGNEIPMSPGCNDVGGLNMVIGVGGSEDYNDITQCVDILAPSTDIFAAKVCEYIRQEDCFEQISGLPLAVGMVAGVAALSRDLKSYRSNMEILDAITSTAEDGIVQGSEAAMSVLKIELDDIGFSTVYTGQTIKLTGEHFNPRLKFKLINDQRVESLGEGIKVITPELIELIIADDVQTGEYYLQIDNYSEKTSVFSVVNLSDIFVEPELQLEDLVEIAQETESVNLSDYAVEITNEFAGRLAGYILLQVESHGEAWYIDKPTMSRYYLKNGAVAYEVMRLLGLGITNKDLESIPVASDIDEMLSASDVCADFQLASQVRGQILLAVEERGEAWYVSPDNCYRIYMKDGDSAYEIMRYLSLGISNADLENTLE